MTDEDSIFLNGELADFVEIFFFVYQNKYSFIMLSILIVLFITIIFVVFYLQIKFRRAK